MLLNRITLPMAALVAAGLLCRVVVAQDAPASETFYVNAETGDDAAAGTKEKPLRGIPEAARRVNRGEGVGPDHRGRLRGRPRPRPDGPLQARSGVHEGAPADIRAENSPRRPGL